MTTFLANQSTLKDLSTKFDGKTPVRIHFLDNSSKVFLVEAASTSVKDVIQLCLDKFGVLDAAVVLPYFGLFESKNGGSIDGCLSMESTLQEVLQRWVDEGVDKAAKFLFMIRLFMPCLWGLENRDEVAFRTDRAKSLLSTEAYLEEARLVDVNVLHLQFVQAVYNVITGRIPTKQDQALDLAAIHFLFKFGGYNAESHRAGFLGNRIVEFIPVKHLRSGLGGVSVEEWESRLLTRVQAFHSAAANEKVGNNGGSDQTDEGGSEKEVKATTTVSSLTYFRNKTTGEAVSPQRRYMEEIYAMVPVYGCTFFRCTQHATRVFPEVVYVGLHHHGVGVFDRTKQRLVRMFHIEEIFRWGFKPGSMFYFEISAESDLGTGSLDFETTEGKTMSDLLTDYAMAFLKEREREDDRAARMNSGQHIFAPAGSGAGNGGYSTVYPDSPSSSSYMQQPPLPPNSPPSPGMEKASGRGDEEEKSRQSDAAATRLQAAFRGFSLRNEWAREDAAILIQAVFRGYRGRITLSRMIENLLQAGELG